MVSEDSTSKVMVLPVTAMLLATAQAGWRHGYLRVLTKICMVVCLLGILGWVYCVCCRFRLQAAVRRVVWGLGVDCRRESGRRQAEGVYMDRRRRQAEAVTVKDGE